MSNHNQFFEKFIKIRCPSLKLKISKFPIKNTILLGNTIYLPSEKWIKNRTNMELISVLSHEYIHYLQKKDILFIFKYSFPILLLPISITYYLLCEYWLLFPISLIFALPLYAPWRIKYEYEAYKMSLLVNFCIINNGYALPKSYYHVSRFSDYSLRDFVEKTLFSPTYYSILVSNSVKTRYFEDLKKWVNYIQANYFRIREDFEQNWVATKQKKLYIIPENDIYAEVMTFLITSDIKND